MSRITAIFDRVRDTLADTREPYRYSDESFLRKLNDALVDIATDTRMWRGSSSIALLQGIGVYTLPDRALDVMTVLYNGKKVPIKTTAYMDEKVDINWRTRTTDKTIQAIVFDREDSQDLRVFPIPTGDDLTVSYELSSLFGIDVNIFGFTAEDFGIISDIVDSDDIERDIDTFGVISELQEAASITVLFYRIPDELLTDTDEIKVPRIWDSLFKYYITGHTLRSDVEAQNRTFGGEELALFNQEKEKLKDRVKSKGVSSGNHDTHYRGMG